MQRKTGFILTRTLVFVTIIQLLSYSIVFTFGQSANSFTSDIRFEIQSNNSFIRFASNGTYDNAYLENKIWSFSNLRFSDSQGSEKLDLTVTATDCEVTINLFRVYNGTFGGGGVTRAVLRYTVAGHGKQVFNLNFDPERGEFDAIVDGEWVGKNHGWNLSPDGTFTITGATENVTLLYYGYPDSYLDSNNVFDEHSITIASTFSVGLVIVLAALIIKKKDLK